MSETSERAKSGGGGGSEATGGMYHRSIKYKGMNIKIRQRGKMGKGEGMCGVRTVTVAGHKCAKLVDASEPRCVALD